MKKISLLFVIVLGLLFLTACSLPNSESQSSASSSQQNTLSSKSSIENSSENVNSSSTEAPTSSSQEQKMNLEQIAKNDYSSLVGTWKNKKGLTLEITPTTILQNDYLLEELIMETDYQKDTILYATYGRGHSMQVAFIPGGVSVIPRFDSKNVSDISKDRIIFGQGPVNAHRDYYKVE